MSHLAMVAWMCRRAVSRSHRRSRRLVSYETFTPAARAIVDGAVARGAAVGADRLADRRDVQEAGAGDVVLRQIGRLHQRRGRALAQVVELVAGGPVRHEADARGRGRMSRHLRGVQAFTLPEIEEGVAHPVLAEAGEVAGGRALADRGNRAILRIAAEALQPRAAVAFLGTIEFDQRLADGDDSGRGGHGARGFPWCRTALKGGRHG